MRDRNGHLEELLAKFYDAAEAKQAAEEIRKGEQIFRLNPAAQPSEELIDEIKSQLAARLHQQRAVAARLVFAKAAAVAAVFVILAWTGAKLLNRGRVEEQKPRPILAMISQEIWESSDVAADDPDLATLNAQIEAIARNLLTIRLDEGGNGNGQVIADIEVKLIQIEGDFWKG